ncbi:MAG TPA: glycosyltransferase family 39 protein [Balneolales bacterium]|nr:glycosyltransferase family 39 protein [Balneolales bacterium]
MKKSHIWILPPWPREYSILFTILALVSAFWLSRCNSSLWLDETITYWVVQEGFIDTAYRAFHYQASGVFYYLIVWLFVQLGGGSEIVLRIPSILSCVLLCSVLFRFSCKIFDRTSAFLGVLVLLCLDGTFTWAVNARPYALALLLSVSSTYSLYLWTESNGRRYKFFYIFFSTLTVYTHVIFSGIFIVHLLYLYYQRWWSKDRVFPPIREVILVYLCIAILLFPVAYQAKISADKKDLLSFAAMPTMLSLIKVWVKPYLVLSLLTGGLAARLIVKKVNVAPFSIQPDLLVLLLIWYLLPALGVFLFSVSSTASLFVPRYYLWSLPPLSMLMGRLFSHITPVRSKCIIVTLLAGLMFVYGGIRTPFTEDWSSAIAYVRPKTCGLSIPVLASTGLAESRDTSWIINPEKRSYLLSPFSVYRLDKTPLLLPAYFNQPGAAEYLDRTVFPVLRNVNKFYLILRMTYLKVNKSKVTSDTYFIKKMALVGFGANHIEDFGHVKVITFERI